MSTVPLMTGITLSDGYKRNTHWKAEITLEITAEKNSTILQSLDKKQLQNCSINMAIIKFIAITILTIFAIINSARAAIPFFGHGSGTRSISGYDDYQTPAIRLNGDLCMYGQRYRAFAVRYNNNCCE